MSTERPTPETDALIESGEITKGSTAAAVRKMERQRDELSDLMEAEHLLNDRIRKELEIVKAQRDEALAGDDRNNQIMIGLMAQRDELLEALERARRKLDAYVGVCSGDKELTDSVLPMVEAALASVKGEKP